MIDYDTLQLYVMKIAGSNVMQILVTLKEEVDPDVLKSAVNTAMGRYSYLNVRVFKEDETYVLKPNPLPVAVLPLKDPEPALGTAETNYNLIDVEWQGRDIYFNYSHSFGVATDILKWTFSILCAYVDERYGIKIDRGDIRSPYEKPTPEEGRVEKFPDIPAYEKPLDKGVDFDGVISFTEFMEKTNSAVAGPIYYSKIDTDAAAIISKAKAFGAKPSVYMASIFYRAIVATYPELEGKLDIGMATDCRGLFGIGNKATIATRWLHMISEIGQVDAEDWCHGQMDSINKQLEPTRSLDEFARSMSIISSMEKQATLEEKAIYYTRNCIGVNESPSALISYFRAGNLGELSSYIDDVAALPSMNRGMMIHAYEDKIMFSFMQPCQQDKLLEPFLSVLEEDGISYTVKRDRTLRIPQIELP